MQMANQSKPPSVALIWENLTFVFELDPIVPFRLTHLIGSSNRPGVSLDTCHLYIRCRSPNESSFSFNLSFVRFN